MNRHIGCAKTAGQQAKKHNTPSLTISCLVIGVLEAASFVARGLRTFHGRSQQLQVPTGRIISPTLKSSSSSTRVSQVIASRVAALRRSNSILFFGEAWWRNFALEAAAASISR